MASKLSRATSDELYRLAALGREAGLDLGVRWLMAQMLKVELAGKRRRRKRAVALVDDTGKPVRAGRFRVPEDVLARAESIEG